MFHVVTINAICSYVLNTYKKLYFYDIFMENDNYVIMITQKYVRYILIWYAICTNSCEPLGYVNIYIYFFFWSGDTLKYHGDRCAHRLGGQRALSLGHQLAGQTLRLWLLFCMEICNLIPTKMF